VIIQRIVLAFLIPFSFNVMVTLSQMTVLADWSESEVKTESQLNRIIYSNQFSFSIAIIFLLGYQLLSFRLNSCWTLTAALSFMSTAGTVATTAWNLDHATQLAPFLILLFLMTVMMIYLSRQVEI